MSYYSDLNGNQVRGYEGSCNFSDGSSNSNRSFRKCVPKAVRKCAVWRGIMVQWHQI